MCPAEAGAPLACESAPTCPHAYSCVPVFHVLSPVTLCPLPGVPVWPGPRPCSHGRVPARCLPPWAAGAPAPAYHSCLRASAWPHCIPGAACPLLLLPLALTGPRALPPPGTGWHLPLSGPPFQGRINRILLSFLSLCGPICGCAGMAMPLRTCPPLTRGHCQGTGMLVGSLLWPWHQPLGVLAPGQGMSEL